MTRIAHRFHDVVAHAESPTPKDDLAAAVVREMTDTTGSGFKRCLTDNIL